MKFGTKNKLIVLFISLLCIVLGSYFWLYDTTQNERFPLEYDTKAVAQLDSLLSEDPDKVKEILPKLTQSKSRLSPQDVAYTYVYEIAILLNESQIDSIPFLSKKALDIAKEYSNQDLNSKLYFQLGKYYRYINDYPVSLEYLQKALAVSEHNKDLQIDIYNNLGGLYFEINDLKKALRFFMKSRDIALEINNETKVAVAEGNMGNAYLIMNAYEDAEYQLKKSLPFYQLESDTIKMIKAYTSLSRLELLQHNLVSSLQYLGQAENLSLSSENKVLLGLVYQHYGNTYRESERFTEAKDYYNKAYILSSQTGVLRDKLNALDGLNDVNVKEANFKEAYNIKEEYYQLRDSIYGEKVRKKLEEVKWINKLEEQNLENRMLRVKREGEIQQNTVLVILALIVLLSVLVLATLLYWNKKKSLQISKLENERLQEKIEAEEALKEVQKQQFKQEMEIKNQELIALNILILAKNKIFNEVENIIDKDTNGDAMIVTELRKKVKSNMDQEKDWDKFKSIFEQTHPTFYQTINETYPQLSKTEVRVCSYIKIAMPKTEICAMMNINHASLLKTRYRIRKKLNLDSKEDLDDFIQQW